MLTPIARPLIPWIGGKRRLARFILPLFPEHACYCEPFAGAAALLFAKEPSECEVLNDINGDLVNLYRVVKFHLEPFIQEFKHSLISRQMYNWSKETPKETLTDIQRAARFYFLQKCGFGGRVDRHAFGTSAMRPSSMNPLRIEEDLSLAHLRLARAYIEHLDWYECVRRYDRPGTLFYCDPPYYGTEGYGVDFGIEQYDRLAELARTIQGKMLISVNDIPEMRAAFEGFSMQTVDINYSVDKLKPTARKELIIQSW